MRRRDVQADILALLQNGRIWTIQRIADEIEIHYSTAFRHIHALSYRFNINIFRGGEKKGGVQLIIERKVSVENLNNRELDLIIVQLLQIKEKTESIEKFIYDLNKMKIEKEA